MVHARSLILALEKPDLLLPALASAYVHDMARKHDGYCDKHGKWAVEHKLPRFREFFLSYGISEPDLLTMATAIEYHCRMDELGETHPAYFLTAILKDSDALDRIRLGEGNLNPNFLRFPESMDMIDFARKLYFSTRNVKFVNFTGLLDYMNLINQK